MLTTGATVVDTLDHFTTLFEKHKSGIFLGANIFSDSSLLIRVTVTLCTLHVVDCEN